VLIVRSGAVPATVIRGEQQHDLGKFLFGMIVFWAYIGFSQMMLYWYGNLPEEVTWYHDRWKGGWKLVSIALVLFHFVLPFLALLGRWAKRRGGWLAFMACWMLLMHYVDIYWMVMPTHHGALGPKLGTALFTLIGVVCLTLAWVGRQLRGISLVPVGDPRLPEALTYDVGI
ncbi:MAG: quinol:cytochrome C oxidoreductase, partial [Planctomycetota bacterium]